MTAPFHRARTITASCLPRAARLFLHIVEPRDDPGLGRRIARIGLFRLFGLGLARFAVRFFLALGHGQYLGKRRTPVPAGGEPTRLDRKSGGSGKGVSVRVYL